MLPIVTLAVAALLAASAPEGTVRIPGTKLGLGMTEQQITELDLLKDLRPMGPASRRGRGTFFGVPCDATLWFKDGRLERAHFEAQQVSPHSVAYVEDQLLRAKLWRECQRLEPGEHICDWIGDTRVHLEVRGDMLDAKVDRPIRPWETETVAENPAPESGASAPAPAPSTPEPAASAPTHATPAPAASTPAPSTPEPAASASTHAASAPAPSVSASAPAAAAAAPVVSTPAPKKTVEPKTHTSPVDSAVVKPLATPEVVKSPATPERATPKESPGLSAPPRTVSPAPAPSPSVSRRKPEPATPAPTGAAPAADLVDRASSVATWPETLRISLPERNPESEWPRMLAVPPLEYPEAARRAGVQGVVWVMTLVDTSGVVRSVRIDRGIPALNEAALAWATKARFAPCVRDQNPCRFWVRVAARFTLN